MKQTWVLAYSLALLWCASSHAQVPIYDVIIEHGQVYDGKLSPPRSIDIGIQGDRIVTIADLSHASATSRIDASGLAVAPGFINVLSWATESLLQDGRGLGDLYQGVTLEIFGEGTSMGPLNAALREELIARQGDFKYAVDWRTLDEYLHRLERQGIAPNVASFVGATTLRKYVLGHANRPPKDVELGQM